MMIPVEKKTCVLFSDIGCPWAHVAVHRWHEERARRGLEDEISLELRAFPLELFNQRATPKRILDAEIPVAGSLAPGATWQVWQRQTYDYAVTTLPAIEAVYAAGHQGSRAAEQLDRELRRAFFGASRNISMLHVVLDVAGRCDAVAVDELEMALHAGSARSRIFEDLAVADGDDVDGSPHFFLPDGSDWHNPGVELHWEGDAGKGFPVVDKDDPSVYAEIFDRLTESS